MGLKIGFGSSFKGLKIGFGSHLRLDLGSRMLKKLYKSNCFIKLYICWILLQEALFRPLKLLKGVEDCLWKYSQGLKITFGRHHNG